MTAAAPVVGVLDVEHLLLEIAIPQAQGGQLSPADSQAGVHEHQQLVAEFQRGQHLGHLLRGQLERRFAALGADANPSAGAALPSVPTGIPDEMGLWPHSSQRTAWENKADITHLILALVPSATSVARSQRSTSTVLTCSSSIWPHGGRIQFLAYSL